MILSYFENLAQGIETSLAQEPHLASAKKIITLELAQLGIRLFSGKHSVAWCGVFVPFDLLSAMGVNSCFIEFVGAMLASTGGVSGMLEQAEADGYSTDSCSYHRSVMGATAFGSMPEPDFLIASSAPCSGGLAVLENLSRHFKKNLFVVHVPMGNQDSDVDFLAIQYEKMVDFVTRHTGQKLDLDALEKAVEHTNQARSFMLEINRLAQHVPTPARTKDLINFGIVMSLFLGTEKATRIAKAFRDEFEYKIRKNLSGILKEDVRLLWIQNRIQFKQSIEKILAEEFQTAIVADELNQITWEPLDPKNPLRSMAARALSIPLCGPVDRRIQNLKAMAQAYKVDGAINPCQWGCRQGTGARGLLEAGLRDIGIPTLNLEVDCVDPRQFAEGQLKTRIGAFVEMLRERKQSPVV